MFCKILNSSHKIFNIDWKPYFTGFRNSTENCTSLRLPSAFGGSESKVESRKSTVARDEVRGARKLQGRVTRGLDVYWGLGIGDW